MKKEIEIDGGNGSEFGPEDDEETQLLKRGWLAPRTEGRKGESAALVLSEWRGEEEDGPAAADKVNFMGANARR